MEGDEFVELHAGHHQVVHWLGLSFNIDTLIATWITMAIVIIITMLATRGRKLVPSGIQNGVEALLEGLESQLSPTLGKHWPMVSSLLFTFFLFIFIGNELGYCLLYMLLLHQLRTLIRLPHWLLVSSLVVWGMGIKVKGLSYFNHFLQPYKAMLF